MWLAFIDESGNTGRKLDDPDQPVHWMAAVLVPEDKAMALSLGLDGIVSGIPGVSPAAEIHGAALFRGIDEWADVPPGERVAVYEAALALLSSHDCVVAHASIAKKYLAGSSSPATSPHVMAFQFLIEKLDQYVAKQNDVLRQRLLLIADETDEHEAFQLDLVSGMQRGTAGVGRGGSITRILDTVHFVDSRRSRGIQLADLVVYALNRSRRIRAKTNPSLGDKALLSMSERYIFPYVRTYRSTWPSAAT
ncbi:MAG: DUF3800 domain-containing protein [Propionibacteriaceae bacterium]|nr:DUF3800 domain-containing protein [Propionibacteriaceae bacterium]